MTRNELIALLQACPDTVQIQIVQEDGQEFLIDTGVLFENEGVFQLFTVDTDGEQEEADWLPCPAGVDCVMTDADAARCACVPCDDDQEDEVFDAEVMEQI